MHAEQEQQIGFTQGIQILTWIGLVGIRGTVEA